MPLQLGFLPGLPIFDLGAGRVLDPALGRMALVCGLVAHAVAPLAGARFGG